MNIQFYSHMYWAYDLNVTDLILQLHKVRYPDLSLILKSIIQDPEPQNLRVYFSLPRTNHKNIMGNLDFRQSFVWIVWFCKTEMWGWLGMEGYDDDNQPTWRIIIFQCVEWNQELKPRIYWIPIVMTLRWEWYDYYSVRKRKISQEWVIN